MLSGTFPFFGSLEQEHSERCHLIRYARGGISSCFLRLNVMQRAGNWETFWKLWLGDFQGRLSGRLLAAGKVATKQPGSHLHRRDIELATTVHLRFTNNCPDVLQAVPRRTIDFIRPSGMFAGHEKGSFILSDACITYSPTT